MQLCHTAVWVQRPIVFGRCMYAERAPNAADHSRGVFNGDRGYSFTQDDVYNMSQRIFVVT